MSNYLVDYYSVVILPVKFLVYATTVIFFRSPNRYYRLDKKRGATLDCNENQHFKAFDMSQMNVLIKILFSQFNLTSWEWERY